MRYRLLWLSLVYVSCLKEYISLVSAPIPGHFMPLKALAKELMSRGYRVSIVLPQSHGFLVQDTPGLELLALKTPVNRTLPSNTRENDIYQEFTESIEYFASFQQPMYHVLMEFFRQKRPDFVVVDRFTFGGLDACESLQLPYAVNNPMLLLDLDNPPSYIPAPLSHFSIQPNSILERCLSGFHRLKFRIMMLVALRQVNTVRETYGLPRIDQFYHKRLVLTNTAFGFEYARPMLPLLQMVGPLRDHVSPSIQLPVLDWLQVSHSVVYVNFGTGMTFSAETLQFIAKVLLDTGFRVLWCLPKTQWSSLVEFQATELKLVEFVAQSAILDHESVKLLVTAGGLATVQEAFVSSLPILTIPLSAEHKVVAMRVKQVSAGLVVDLNQLENEFPTALDQVTSDSSYRNASQTIGQLLQSTGGVERAAEVILSAMLHGVHDLESIRDSLPSYKQCLIDVYCVYGIVICGVVVIMRTTMYGFRSDKEKEA